ncbi:class I mannose-6-phosphate isomerase [Enterovirga sp. GCM10030262]|uniref:class I mannose-6-phosphate isomerase n=1 Tax=Enterovirga sp. GCM10030262 TaxID=3273391 RepID=UPI003609A6F2
MSIAQLVARRVEKPWGRRDLPACFGTIEAGAEPVGEIWFEDLVKSDRKLLVKYLFTSEKLSIQVHPGDGEAREAGYPCGKDEAWVVTAADPDAVIGIGLNQPVSRDALRAAALDGRIVDLVDWRPAAAGDIYFSPARTIHSLGEGLTVIEVQQNVDVTYRLYDHGRPRDLHLEDALAVADPVPYPGPFPPTQIAAGRIVLTDGPAFVLERWTGTVSGMLQGQARLPIWLIPVAGGGNLAGARLAEGSVWVVDGPAQLELDAGSDMLVAYADKAWKKDLIA